MSRARSIAACFVLLLAGLPLRPTACALDPHQALLHYGHQSWQTDNGLPQNTVRAVLQTRDGYLWFATDGGLVRFDGVKFVIYDRQSAGMRSNVINCLFEDTSGNLWIGTTGGLTRRSGEDFLTFTSADGLPGNNVASVYQDGAGRLWALTPAGAAAFVNGRFQRLAGATGANYISESPSGQLWIGTDAGALPVAAGKTGSPPTALSHLETQALAAGPDGRIWIGTRAGLEIVSQDNSAMTLTRQQGLPSDEVTALLPDRTGRMWVGTANGLATIRASALQSAPQSAHASSKDNRIVTYSVKDGLPGERIQMLYADREGAIWVSTNRGVARFQPGQAGSGRFESFGPRNGLSGNLVLSMLEDREGSLWMGTEAGGLTVLHDQKFTTYTAANGLSEDLVRSVYQDRKGSLWIGTNGGGLDRLPARLDSGGSGQDAHFTNITTANGLSSNIVLALADDAAGDLWIGTPDGLDRLLDGHIKVYTSADGLADDFVRSLYAAPDGTLWIGTRRGLSHLEDGTGEKSHFTSYSSMDGLGSNLVGALLQEAHGGKRSNTLQSNTLWVGTLGGLSRLQDGRFTTLTTRDGLSSNVVTAIHESADGTLWIAVAGGSLNRLKNGAVFAYPAAATGLPENIYAILEDDPNSGSAARDLWLSSDKGIYRVSIADLNAFGDGKTHKIMPSVYGTADGMAISECSSGGHPAAWRLRDGRLAFATLKGIAIIDPEHAPTNAEPPPVAIEQLTYDDRPIQARGPLNLPPGQGRVAIEYTAMSFIAPQKVRFRYKLEGFDRDWVDAGARRTAYYTNLPPARYTFRVLACNNDGVWNEAGAALDFRLRPHFYQTWTFRLLLLFAAALAGYALYRRRVRRVEAQFGAVLAERGRIAREIHDTLAQSLVAISTQLEVVSRLLTSSTESAREHLDHARILTRNSLTEARSSIWDLRSQATGALATEDLAARLSAMAIRVAAGTSIKIQSKVGGAYHPLPAKLELELLRIAQEAATNAVRHAAPRLISIDLQFEPRLLTMTIEDDGRGFSGQPHPQSSGPAGHFGLTGMRERAEQIGGRFTIESAPGEGARIKVMVPIE